MSLLDTIADVFNKILPAKSEKLRKNKAPPELGGGPGHITHDEDDEVSKPAIVFHAAQAFLNFLAMCCMASVAGFQAKWIGAPSGLSGFAIFLSVIGIFLPLFMLIIPVIYDRYNKFIALARALRELRICLILTGGGSIFSLLIAFIITISVAVQPGCKDPSTDPNAALGKDFQAGLDGWCSTKKAAAVFFWLAFGFWVASFVLLILHYRSGRIYRTSLGASSGGARDPTFDHTQLRVRARGTTELDDGTETEIGDGESTYEHGAPPMAHRTSAYDPYVPGPQPRSSGYDGQHPRPSIDTYGAFDDPPPSGFAPPPQVQPDAPEEPRISRTMQYADPYAAVRARVGPSSPPRAIPTLSPPGYDAYRG